MLMKCHFCKGFDSSLQYMYVDRNNNIITEGELTAFEVLHPEEKGKFYRKILLCGICYDQLGRNERAHNEIFGSQPISKRDAQAKKPDNYYICSFCKTANEPLRNTCKGCKRVLFSTEYETRRVSARGVQNSGKSLPIKKVLLPVVVVLAIFFITDHIKETGVQGTMAP